MELKTYEVIAVEAGLNDITKRRYVSYMKERWPDTENQKCIDGYAKEWAIRFKNNIEYESSDVWGQAVLSRIDKNLVKGER